MNKLKSIVDKLISKKDIAFTIIVTATIILTINFFMDIIEDSKVETTDNQEELRNESIIRHDINEIRIFDFYELQTFSFDIPIGPTYQGYKGSCLIKDRDADGMNKFKVTEHSTLEESEYGSFKPNVSDEEFNYDVKYLLFNERDITKVEEIAGGYVVYVENKEKGLRGQYTIIVENVYNNFYYVASKIYGKVYANDVSGHPVTYDIVLDNFEYYHEDYSYTY